MEASMRTLFQTVSISLLASAAVTFAQDRPVQPFHQRAQGFLKVVLVRSAEKMPEENYGFRPTEAVRTFGEILGHVAASQYAMCSIAAGEKTPAPKEKAATSKADLIASLKDSFAYCEKVSAGLTGAAASQVVKFHGEDMTKLDVLSANNMHTVEHYGNLITYLRMKNIVPPSSEPDVQPGKK
jgi:uncharacterized damage-inducible protein DinB